MVSPEQVAEIVIETMRGEHFLALPHPGVAKYFQAKGHDYDRWLGGMQKLHARYIEPPRED